MLNKHIKYFEVAKSAATLSNHPLVNIGSIITYKKDIVSIGYNHSHKTHPIQKYYDKYRDFEVDKSSGLIHAEMDAIMKAKRILSKTEFNKANIYVYRQLKNNQPGMCRPCGACMGAIKDNGIHNVFYTTPDGFCYEFIQKVNHEKN